ncbi:hypothetical protein [Raoultella sp. HC6]|uniref:hypothetical protein n=1 Tax=Raoultella sp. HC6 TaxID=2923366 RepID=UPI001F50AD91|nr:hypothetical protein [Raoultella sp. HC6]
MVYSDLVATSAMIVAIVAVPASGYLSYHYAIKGEKRKEYNAIADTLRKKLREQLEAIDLGYYPNERNGISDGEFEFFLDMHPRKRREFARKIWKEYQISLVECAHYDEDNFFSFINEGELKSSIQKLLLVTERH